jgi:hypothetical protein
MKCPRYADLTFNHNRRALGGKSNPLECGSIVHTILEFYTRARINGTKRNDAIDIGYAAGKEYLVPYSADNKYILDKEHKGVTNTPIENTTKPKRIGYTYVFKTMEQYFEYWRTEPNWTPLYVEHVTKTLIYEDDEIRVGWKAKHDVILDSDFGIISRDYKTMSQNRDTVSLNNQFIGQCVNTKARQMQVDKIGWQSSLEPHEKFKRVLVPYSMDRITEWMKEIVPYYAYQLLAYQESGYFPPNFSQCEDKYGYCTFKALCERDRNMRMTVLEKEYELVKEWDVSND